MECHPLRTATLVGMLAIITTVTSIRVIRQPDPYPLNESIQQVVAGAQYGDTLVAGE
jgi:hypothetical protein